MSEVVYFNQLLWAARQLHVVYSDQLLGAAHHIHLYLITIVTCIYHICHLCRMLKLQTQIMQSWKTNILRKFPAFNSFLICIFLISFAWNSINGWKQRKYLQFFLKTGISIKFIFLFGFKSDTLFSLWRGISMSKACNPIRFEKK